MNVGPQANNMLESPRGLVTFSQLGSVTKSLGLLRFVGWIYSFALAAFFYILSPLYRKA